MAIALGRLFGVKVIVTCGSDSKVERALKLGAAAAINYRNQDFVEEVKRLTGGNGTCTQRFAKPGHFPTPQSPEEIQTASS